MERDLAVAAGAEAVSAVLELAADRFVAVEVAIDRDRDLAVVAGDRLRAAVDVDHGQAAVTEHGGGVRASPHPDVVGPAMAHASDRGAGRRLVDRAPLGANGDDSRHLQRAQTPPSMSTSVAVMNAAAGEHR